MQSYVAAHRQIVAAMYWDNVGPHCSYRIDGDPTSVHALAAMGHSSLMQGRVAPAR